MDTGPMLLELPAVFLSEKITGLDLEKLTDIHQQILALERQCAAQQLLDALALGVSSITLARGAVYPIRIKLTYHDHSGNYWSDYQLYSSEQFVAAPDDVKIQPSDLLAEGAVLLRNAHEKTIVIQESTREAFLRMVYGAQYAQYLAEVRRRALDVVSPQPQTATTNRVKF